jgi:hypothetical protein
VVVGLVLSATAAAEVVVLKDGREVGELSAIEELPAQLKAVGPDGIALYFDLRRVDLEATRRLNRKPAPAVTAAVIARPVQRPRPIRGAGAFSAGASTVIADRPALEPERAGATPAVRAPNQQWAARAAELQSRIDLQEHKLRLLEQRLAEVLVAESVGAYTIEGERVRASIRWAMAELKALGEQRSRLEDEARRAGVEPGVLRVD